jgi:hypothetical protein
MDFNAEPYWDDFEATNGAKDQNYMRILFRPGYAVQGRELTQIQSILQNQISSLGDHIFENGSPVYGGQLSLRTNISYLRLDPQYNGVDIDLENFLGVVVYNTKYPQSIGTVVQTYSTATDKTLIITIKSGPGFSASDTISIGSVAAASVLSVAPSTPENALIFGQGSVVQINPGIFYVDGFFVSVADQTIVLDPYSTTPSYKIGLETQDTIITESDDTALLDPAQESFNYQAPGAHRFKHNLALAKRVLDSVDDSKFFELLRVENGVITKQVSYPLYSELEKTLARRTYDESGDYTVRPFTADVSANTNAGLAEDTTNFIVNLSPGKAYVHGMEFETIGTQKLPVPRALTTKLTGGYNHSVYYGNRLMVANVHASNSRSVLLADNLNEIDVHCVANNQVSNIGDSGSYYATRIGTAKIRNVERVGDANSYYVYLTDTNFAPILTSANTNSPNRSALSLSNSFTSAANAYVNAIVTLLSTTGAIGNTSTVIAYNSTTKMLVVDIPFAATPALGDLFTITMATSAAKSLIVPNTSSFITANLMMNVSPYSIDATGSTILEDTTFNSDVFTLPSYYVKYNSDASVSFYRKVIFQNQSFGTGANACTTIALSAGQGTLPFGTDSAYASSGSIKDNIIVVANSGQILDMTASSRTVYRTDSTHLVLDPQAPFGAGAAFIGDVYVTTKVINANGSLRRTKTLIQANNALTTSDTPAGATQVVNYGSVYINAANGIAWFTNANSIVKNTFDKQQLYVSDVVKVRAIYDSGNVNYAPNIANATTVDVTSRYLLDSGQNDNYYDHASIRLSPVASAPTGQLAVLFDYYTHGGSGYISSTSYPSSVYTSEQIPAYRNATGDISYLRDSIDFRPVRAIGTSSDPYNRIILNANVNVTSGGVTVTSNVSRLAGNTIIPPIGVGSIIKIGNDQRTVNSVINVSAVTVSYPFTATATNSPIYWVSQNTSLSGSVIQKPTEPMVLDYEFYLPRIDKIVVTTDKQFKLLSGIPDPHPVEPSSSATSMAIYRIYIPAYTASLRNITTEYIDNRRYTMRDIAALDKRIASIEKYIQLKESESQIINNPPVSPTSPTINKPIYGIIVDEFNDLSVADQTIDFAASVENGLMTCYRVVTNLPLKVASLGNAQKVGKLITLPYTERSVIQQNLATADGFETVVPNSLTGKFDGLATLTPEGDYYYSTLHIPTLIDYLNAP